MDALIAGLAAKDLPNEDLQYLADVIGLDNVKKILGACAGMSFYVPLKFSTKFHKQYILEHYDKDLNNVRSIAKTLRITQRAVWRLLGEKHQSTR